MKSTKLLATLLLICLTGTPQLRSYGAESDELDLTVKQPLTGGERMSAVRLSRLPSAKLSWNDDNRIVAVSLKGRDATDYAVQLSSRIAGMRALILVVLPQNRLTDNGLASLVGHSELRMLSISGGNISDSALQHFAACPALEIVILNGNFTDNGMATLATLPALKNLDITQCQVTDAGVAHLANAAGLQTLILNGTQLTNDGMASIAQLKKLTGLYLGETHIDDGAIEQLKTMEQLDTLFLKGTALSEQGIQQLLQALPITCRVIHEYGAARGQRTPRTAQSAEPKNTTLWRMR